MNDLAAIYRERHANYLVPIAAKLEVHLRDCLVDVQRVDRVSTRAKSIDRFMQKAQMTENGARRYTDPLNQIQDQIGARLVVFYASDVPSVAEHVKKYFHAIESKVIVPDRDSEFGYIGQHFILLLPTDVLSGIPPNIDALTYFELQIKTLFQHAWAEAEHDLGYKSQAQLAQLQKRKLAFTAAQAWGADLIFEELFSEMHRV